VCILFFTFFNYTLHIPIPALCVSYCAGFSVFLAILHVQLCAINTFNVFLVFLPYSRSYNVHFSFFSLFIALFLVIQCLCIILHFFSVFLIHNPGPTMCISHF
jgi:hypothetical protein